MSLKRKEHPEAEADDQPALKKQKTQMTVDEICRIIPTLDKASRIRIDTAIRMAHAAEARRLKDNFYEGQSVTFLDKSKQLTKAVIEKIMPKNIRVKTEAGMMWTVSPGLLMPAS